MRARRLSICILLFLVTLGSSPLRSEESTQKFVRLGYVQPQSSSNALRGMTAFWDRLRQLGYVEGKNLIIEPRSAEGRNEQLLGLMNELVAVKVDVIVTYGTPAAIAAKNARPVSVQLPVYRIRVDLASTLASRGPVLHRALRELQFLPVHRRRSVAASCARRHRAAALPGSLFCHLATPSPGCRIRACTDRLALPSCSEAVPMAPTRGPGRDVTGGDADCLIAPWPLH
jgi:hypothetical protein